MKKLILFTSLLFVFYCSTAQSKDEKIISELAIKKANFKTSVNGSYLYICTDTIQIHKNIAIRLISYHAGKKNEFGFMVDPSYNLSIVFKDSLGLGRFEYLMGEFYSVKENHDVVIETNKDWFILEYKMIKINQEKKKIIFELLKNFKED